MSYAVRNTLIITGFWALLIIAGIYWVFGHQTRVHTRLIKDKAGKAKELKELQYLDDSRTKLDEYLQRLLKVDEGARGVLVSSETPGETFDYLVRELNRGNSSIQFDLKSQGSIKKPKLSISNYEVSGEGKFVDAYKLLWFLENGPAFYRVDGFEIRRLLENDIIEGELLNNAEVSFALKLTAYQRVGGPKLKEMLLEDDRSKNLANLFKAPAISKQESRRKANEKRKNYTSPRVTSKPKYASKPKIKTNNTGLPEITSSSKLLAMTPHWILVQTKNGKTVKLRKGQKVYGGYLSEIRTNSNQVVFQINRGGGPEHVVLSVNYKNTGM